MLPMKRLLWELQNQNNTAEFAKLVNKTINKITYVTPEGNYVYTFADGSL